ncbi:hypothetical protein fugu_003916 [Takifugu bimaculatus]|uniref:TGF-beta family profile domain-containing protein n=1 Tax=Takifugu bimaculatus TaxID=433685 RepID=A0A4Z2BC12_9TELE|nr:hypothetical protein fugu_003916 [Takifugu bimaculatus]
MKLWDSLTTCLILLSAVRASVSRQHPAMRRRSEAESPPELPQSQTRLVRSGISRTDWGEELGARRGKDLGLGYRSSEEMIFRYCSGPCRKSQTNYDKILYNLANNRKLPPKDTPSQACCRPTAFDDDLSFLDDNLVYHTVRKHSARKCGCV